MSGKSSSAGGRGKGRSVGKGVAAGGGGAAAAVAAETTSPGSVSEPVNKAVSSGGSATAEAGAGGIEALVANPTILFIVVAAIVAILLVANRSD